MTPRHHRETEVRRLCANLETCSYPRLKMLLIVAMTGGAGFLSSFLMIRLGVTSMAVRYPLAVVVAYLAFLFLLWLWLRTTASDYSDVPDIPDLSSPGSSASFECSEGGGVSEAFEAAGQAEEFAIPLLVLLALGALLLSSLWIVYSAPTLFAELLVDGALSASLYRKLRGIETQHWLLTAFQRTVWPFLLTACVVSVIGMAMQAYYPRAHSLGEVIRIHAESKR